MSIDLCRHGHVLNVGRVFSRNLKSVELVRRVLFSLAHQLQNQGFQCLHVGSELVRCFHSKFSVSSLPATETRRASLSNRAGAAMGAHV